MADPTMDIFSALNSLFTGLRQNMRQSQQDELQGLSMLARLPGMQVTQATNAQPAPWWQHLLGMPAYRPGADGAPVARIGQTPLTVTKEPSAFERLEKLFGTASDQAEPSAMAMEQSPIIETDRLASPGATATLPAPTMTARQRHAATLAQQYGLDPAELQNDVLFQAEFTKPGSTVADMRKYVTELAKTKRETRNAATEQYPKYLDIIAREYLQAKDTPSLQAANVRLARLGVPQDLLRDLPRVYEPSSVQSWVQRGLTPAIATEADREGAKIRAATPALAERERTMGLPRLENELDKREVLGPVERAERLQQLQDEAPYKLEQARAQGADQARINAQARAQGAVSQKRLEGLEESATVAEKTTTALDEINTLITKGVYGTGAEDLATMKGYETGVLFQGDAKAARTARLKELGATLITAMGSLGNQVSNADREVYEKASGNFQRAKNPLEMQESIASMRRIAMKALVNANVARRMYAETGTLPDFNLEGAAPAGQPQSAPAPMTSQEIDLNLIETNKLRKAQGKPEVTRAQIIDGLRKLGHEVP